MQQATLELSRTVAIDGLKPLWKIYRPGHTVMVGEVAFVRVAQSNYTLNSLLTYKNDAVQTGLTYKNDAVTYSIGLKMLVAQRNAKHAEDFKRQAKEKACSLFKNPIKVQQRASHSQKADMRNDPQIMVLDADINGTTHHIEVLRPAHPTDNLFIAFTADSIAAAVYIMRTSGFDVPKPRERPPELPKGIHKRGDDHFSVKYVKDDGSSGYKKVKSMTAAVEFLTTIVAKPASSSAAAVVAPDSAADTPDSNSSPNRELFDSAGDEPVG